MQARVSFVLCVVVFFRAMTHVESPSVSSSCTGLFPLCNWRGGTTGRRRSGGRAGEEGQVGRPVARQVGVQIEVQVKS